MRLAYRSGSPQAALDPLNRALTLSVQLDNQEQKAATLPVPGVAYKMLNKPEEALRNYQEALAIRRRIGDKSGSASSLNEIAVTGACHKQKLQPNFQEALQIRRDIGRGTGRHADRLR